MTATPPPTVEAKSWIRGVGASTFYMMIAIAALIGFILFCYVCMKIYQFYNFVKSLLNIARAIPPIHPDSQEAVEAARAWLQARPARQPDTSATCPICLGPIIYGVETNCGHIFCGRCISQYWKSSRWNDRQIACPVCRQKVSSMMLSFTSSELKVQGSAEKNHVLDDVHSYNRRFSEGRRSLGETLRDMPTLLRHAWTDVLSGNGMDLVSRLRIILPSVMALLYLVSPLDIIPEVVFGLLGYIDDAAIVTLVAGYITSTYRSYMARRAERHAQRN